MPFYVGHIFRNIVIANCWIATEKWRSVGNIAAKSASKCGNMRIRGFEELNAYETIMFCG